jgi:glycosyltransferase involved in cell wall biosynthesis
MSTAPYLSLAILAYNEQESIERAARLCSGVLESCGQTYELVLVDDGSTDQTPALIEKLVAELPCCRSIRHPRNLGIGAGIRTCYFGTTGQWAVWFPADLQADPRELPRLLRFLPECDVLVTYRDAWQRRETWMRKLVSFTDRRLVRLLFGVSLRDLHWIRFFRRDLLNRMVLTARSPFVDTEMIVSARKLGARLCEVPFPDQPRTTGTAKGASLRNLLGAMSDLFGLYRRGVRLAPEGQSGTLPASHDPQWVTP